MDQSLSNLQQFSFLEWIVCLWIFVEISQRIYRFLSHPSNTPEIERVLANERIRSMKEFATKQELAAMENRFGGRVDEIQEKIDFLGRALAKHSSDVNRSLGIIEGEIKKLSGAQS